MFCVCYKNLKNIKIKSLYNNNKNLYIVYL